MSVRLLLMFKLSGNRQRMALPLRCSVSKLGMLKRHTGMPFVTCPVSAYDLNTLEWGTNRF